MMLLRSPFVKVHNTTYMYTAQHTCTQHNIHAHNTTYMHTTQHTCTQHNIHVHNTTYMYTTQHTCTQHNIHVHNTTYMYTTHKPHHMYILLYFALYGLLPALNFRPSSQCMTWFAPGCMTRLFLHSIQASTPRPMPTVANMVKAVSLA